MVRIDTMRWATQNIIAENSTMCVQWSHLESNQAPPAWQASALTLAATCGGRGGGHFVFFWKCWLFVFHLNLSLFLLWPSYWNHFTVSDTVYLGTFSTRENSHCLTLECNSRTAIFWESISQSLNNLFQ